MPMDRLDVRPYHRRMTRMTFGVVLLSSALLTAAPGPGPGSRVWNVVAVDPKGDARDSSLADAAQLSYRYDEPAGMLWFRVSVFGGLNADAFGVTIAVDTGATQSQKANWWGANKEFAFDRLITASVTRTGGRYAGTLGISDAAGAMRKEFANLRRDNVEVRVESDAILIGVRRDELTDRMAMKAIAAVGSNDALNDDIPNARSAEIDLGAPRPARGLREIDVSRNNLTFPAGYQVLRETATARVARSGHGRTAMILIPGVYSSKDVFAGFVSRNGSRYTFHVITPPGLAGTQPREMPPATTSYGAFTWTRRLARDIRELIERRHLEKPIVVAHGFPGSLAAEELALSHPSLIGGVVEIASMAVQPYPTSSGREATPEERVAIVDHSWAQQWFKYVTPETWESNNYPAEMFTNERGEGGARPEGDRRRSAAGEDPLSRRIHGLGSSARLRCDRRPRSRAEARLQRDGVHEPGVRLVQTIFPGRLERIPAQSAGRADDDSRREGLDPRRPAGAGRQRDRDVRRS